MTRASPPPRADRILTIAIALVATLVFALVLVLGAGARMYAKANDARAGMRETRDGLITLTQQRSDAVEAQRAYLVSGNRQYLATFEAAKQQASATLARLRELNAVDADALPLFDRIETNLAAFDDNLDAGVSARRESPSRAARTAELTDAIDVDTQALHAAIVRRADRIRVDEEAARRRTDSLAVALALLSLITSALAVLALRREREQWRLATEAAEEAREKAAASDLAKTRFLAVASHDMRQPLHALTLYLSALERRVEGAEARDILAKMDQATQSMVGMFARLLDLARIQAGVITPELESVSLQDVFDRIVAENPGSAVEATPAPYVLHTDPVLLDRILGNLVANALKHGGGKARLIATASEGKVEITVADDGPGIPLEDQERVFDEFVRLEGGRTEGLGLGLTIVKRIAELLDIDLELQSSPGAGSRFILRAKLAAHQSAGALKDTSDVVLRNTPVLVVDDDPLAREAVARMLSDLGAQVRSAANEAEAQEVIGSRFAPRLLVMDLRIDGELAGVDIARRLRARINPQPQVIVVTGDTAAETLAFLRSSGFPWLIKPVNAQDLTDATAAQLASST